MEVDGSIMRVALWPPEPSDLKSSDNTAWAGPKMDQDGDGSCPLPCPQ